MFHRAVWSGAVVLAVVLAGCGSSSGDAAALDVTRQDAGAIGAVDAGGPDAGDPDGGAVAACPALPPDISCPSRPPSFAADVLPILNQRCNNCHDPNLVNGPWPLQDYYDVSAWQGQIAADLVNCTMPPPDGGTTLPEPEREQLITWIVCGAPNN
jgi:hypothetical protein